MDNAEERRWGTMIFDRPDHPLPETREDRKIPCTAVRICDRRLNHFDVDRRSELISYFLVIVEDLEYRGVGRRIGLGHIHNAAPDPWASSKV
jgi:hypothetical protein